MRRDRFGGERKASEGNSMIRLARRAALLIAFYLLTSAAAAYAECSWVLWNDVTFIGIRSDPSSSLNLIGAWPTYEQCEQGRFAKAKDLLRATESEKSGPNVARVTV